MGINEIRKLKKEAENPKPKKQYRIPKVSKKQKEKIKEQKELQKRDEEFFKKIYAASPHQCQNCGCRLPKTPSNFMFHHLLEKRNYPQFRYEPENVMILCLECHSKAETNIAFAPKIVIRRIEAEQKCIIWHQTENT
jgi:5-methylcytosine-specific restriction endonuclease McrA